MKVFRPLLLSISCFLLCAEVKAQKNDYVWLFGYGNLRGTNTDTDFGGVKLDFNYEPAKLSKSPKLADFQDCNVSYCDNNGRLLFYSNGADVFDARDVVMQGGDSINYGWYWNYEVGNDPIDRYDGFSIGQGMLALPSPSDSNQVYLSHFTYGTIDFEGLNVEVGDTSFYSLVDLKGNSGFGNVIKKNIILTTDTLFPTVFSAVRHGNGKDWWMIHPKCVSNCYYVFLLSDTGISIKVQCLDTINSGVALGSSCFSPDGSKYFWITRSGGIHMFDFDRCTGELSNSVKISFPFPIGSVQLASGIAISPNNRYLYATTNPMVLQYDLQAADISGSVDTVAYWDGYYDPYPFSTIFYTAQIAPDGKIYINTANATRSLHVINRPDEKGDSCLFGQHQLNLGSFNHHSMPNFPNYRLGRLPGSACDTVWTETDEVKIANREKNLKVFPNPATDIVTIDYGFTDWSKTGEVSLEIVNELCQRTYSQKLLQYSGYQKLDVTKYASGIYTAYIKRNEQIIATQKFAKE